MASKSSQPERYRKGRDVQVGDVILMHPDDYSTGLRADYRTVVEITFANRVYCFRDASGDYTEGKLGHEYAEGKF